MKYLIAKALAKEWNLTISRAPDNFAYKVARLHEYFDCNIKNYRGDALLARDSTLMPTVGRYLRAALIFSFPPAALFYYLFAVSLKNDARRGERAPRGSAVYGMARPLAWQCIGYWKSTISDMETQFMAGEIFNGNVNFKFMDII